jgi:hypothetical protein
MRATGRLRSLLRRSLIALGLALLAPAAAFAQITNEPVSPYPDPDKFARGIYSEAEIGTLVFIGDAGSSLGPGAMVGARLGYDLFKWAALQVHAVGSTHTTSFPGLPQSGQLLQLYQGSAELKLSVRFGRVAISATGGAGVGRLSTNLLGTTGLTEPDVQNTLVTLGGLGADYHTMSRHFCFGLSGGFAKYQRLHTTGAISATTYVRYTF